MRFIGCFQNWFDVALVTETAFSGVAFMPDDDPALVLDSFPAQQREPLAGTAQNKAGSILNLAQLHGHSIISIVPALALRVI